MIIHLGLITVFIVLTAFFVAAEFALIKIRPSRIDQLVAEGNKQALSVRKIHENLDGYLSACQLGITITALGIGWLGEPTFKIIFERIFKIISLPPTLTTFLSVFVSFLLITFLHVVFGELAPKTLAIKKAEQISIYASIPLIYFYKIMYPLIWVLNGAAGLLTGMKMTEEADQQAHSEEEIRIILSESLESGKINNTEYSYVNRIFAFDELHAYEIMIPRVDMVCLNETDSLEENLMRIHQEQYTRFPVIGENKDDVIGLVNTKQFFLKYSQNPSLDLKSVMQPILTVPEVMPIKFLLRKMQKQRIHMAILLDEYGGTSGLVTIEDILEEIVGEIQDEFDTNEPKEIEKIGEFHYIVGGKVLLNEINQLMQSALDNEEVDTIGGWINSHSPELIIDTVLEHEGIDFKILEKENHSIRKIEIKKKEIIEQT